MNYMILDSTGSAVNEYADEIAAHVALRNLVDEDPAAADHLTLLAYADDGQPLGRAVTFDELPLSTTSIEETAWTLLGRTCAFGLDLNDYVPAQRLGRLEPTSIAPRLTPA